MIDDSVQKPKKQISQAGLVRAAAEARAAQERVGVKNRRQRRDALKRVAVDPTADKKARNTQRRNNLERRVLRMANRVNVRNCVAAWPFGYTHKKAS